MDAPQLTELFTGADMFYAELTGRYAAQLKTATVPFQGVTLCYSPNIERGDDHILQCDGRGMREWVLFAKTLKEYDELVATSQSKEIVIMHRSEREGWSLSNFELSAELIDVLGPVLIGREKVRTLMLDNNNLGISGESGARFLQGVLQKNQCLQRLHCHNNDICAGVDLLCKALVTHRSLEHLTLENIGLDGDNNSNNNINNLSIILNASNNLKCLGLSKNGLGSKDTAEIIGTFIKKNKSMQVMYLRDNHFDDESAEEFALALRSNNTLSVLDLSNNHFMKFGRTAIRNGTFDTTSLNAASESNNACVVYTNENVLKDRLNIINCKGNPKQNRQRKVLAILYTTTNGYELSSLLNDVPLGLMPIILGYIQEYNINEITSGVKKHAMETLRQYTNDDFEQVFAKQTIFTVLFELLRNWNLPCCTQICDVYMNTQLVQS